MHQSCDDEEISEEDDDYLIDGEGKIVGIEKNNSSRISQRMSKFRHSPIMVQNAREFRLSKRDITRTSGRRSRYIIFPVLPTSEITLSKEELEEVRRTRELDSILRENEKEIIRQQERLRKRTFQGPSVYQLSDEAKKQK